MTKKDITNLADLVARIEAAVLRMGAPAAGPFDLESAAKYLGISKSYLYRLTSKGLIAFFKPQGKRIFFDKADLDEYLRRNRTMAPWETEKAAVNHPASSQ